MFALGFSDSQKLLLHKQPLGSFRLGPKIVDERLRFASGICRRLNRISIAGAAIPDGILEELQLQNCS
ncbi:MAG TPA: hypothetical protein VJY15_04910 [Candidatus Acidoferrum sp.]|nr:hypothetical protein [Candidatus Acidoferrum sp.]